MCSSYDESDIIDDSNYIIEKEVDPVLEKILCALDTKENIILHSPGGTGKTFYLCKIAECIVDQGKNVSCTATTGIAAINLNIPGKKISGVTLHSWAGVGLGSESVEKLFTKVFHNNKSRKRWLNVDVLIIDEVSMLGAEFLDKLDFIGRSIRNKPNSPFGGIQLILSGDFLQLAPINEEWSFKSLVWNQLNLVPFIFDQPKRYDDIDYFHLLIRIREGKQTSEDLRKLNARTRSYDKLLKAIRESKSSNIIKPTILYSKKIDVESYNDRELNKLEGAPVEYIADDSFVAYIKNAKCDYYILKLDDAIPKSIILKVGAQIMLRCNLDVKAGLVNGSRGVVLELDPEYVYVRFINGIKMRIRKHLWELEDKEGIAVRSQIPFILSWSITIHKCVNENTLISTDNGLIKIGKLSDKNGWLEKSITLDTLIGIEHTSKIFKGDVENSIIITTDMGYTLEGSNRHPILVKTQNGNEIWKLLPNIEEKDIVVLRSGSQGSKKNIYNSPFGEINKDLSYILGIIVSDNACCDINITDFVISKTVNSDIIDFFKNVFYSVKNKKDLISLGLKKSTEKEIPWYILQSSHNIQLFFIKGLFDASGEVNKTSINITSPSENLLKEIHILLLSLEIISTRLYIPKNNVWKIKITGENYNTYMEKIGLVSMLENEKLCKHNFNTESSENTNLFFDSVSFISNGKCQMYDVEVPGSHSFVSNGIISHNSQGCTLDYAICDLGPNVFACGQAYVALSRVRNLKGLFISEFYAKSIKVNKTALRYSRELQKNQKKYVPKKKEEMEDTDSDQEIENTDSDQEIENTDSDEEFDLSTIIG
jgi:intein/homing endonuclease